MSSSANAEHVASYYAATANPPPGRPALEGDIECEVCGGGAGFTGISSALHLAEQGHDVVVLEAARVGFGASGRNGGQIVNSYSRDMDVIEAKYGTETARALAREVAAADATDSQEELRLLGLLQDNLDIGALEIAAIERGARARHTVL